MIPYFDRVSIRMTYGVCFASVAFAGLDAVSSDES